MKKILNNCKKFNLVRKMLVVLLVFAMTFGTFAAVVSDNDSSAFVTKAELEALKTSYEKQVKNYYDKINEKVDNTIVAYLNYWNEVASGVEADPYPVGSIYVSVNETDPGTLFGGVWQKKAAGQMLVGLDEDDTYFNTVGKTGGALTHTLTLDEMVKHGHSWTGEETWTALGGQHEHEWKARENAALGGYEKRYKPYDGVSAYQTGTEDQSWDHKHTVPAPDSSKFTIGYSGNNNQFNLLQPYFVVNIWERIN